MSRNLLQDVMVQFIIAFVIAIPIWGQTIVIDSLTGKYQSIGIIQADSLKKDDIFLKTKEWIALNYKSANDVIQLADKDGNKIILKGNFSANMFLQKCLIGHTLVFEFKDGKLRYTYTDFVFIAESGEMSFENNTMGFRKKIIAKTEENISLSTESLRKYLLENSRKNQNDW